MEGGTIYGLADLSEKQLKAAHDEAYLFADNVALLVGLRSDAAGQPTPEAEVAIQAAVKRAAGATGDQTSNEAESVDGEATRIIEASTAQGEAA
jgi:hypothetical protein